MYEHKPIYEKTDKQTQIHTDMHYRPRQLSIQIYRQKSNVKNTRTNRKRNMTADADYQNLDKGLPNKS